jgi:hypothetical protein
MKTFKKYYNLFGLPALIVHELTHIIVAKLIKANYQRTSVYFDDDFDNNGCLECRVYYVPDNHTQKVLVSLSPFLGIIFWLLPLFIFGASSILSVIFVSYLILYIKIVLPSKDDFLCATKKSQH